MAGYASKSKFVPSETAIERIAKHHFDGVLMKARDDCRFAEKDGELRIWWRDLEPDPSNTTSRFNKTLHKPNYFREDLERIYGRIFEADTQHENGQDTLSTTTNTYSSGANVSVLYGDDGCLEKMQKLLRRGGAIASINAASFAVVDDAEGTGTAENKAKRLARKYAKSGRYNPKQAQ
jgi:hypothetical protein